MADPATATFSLVMNIVQVADYTIKILSKANEIKNSVDGALVANRDADTCAKELLLRNQQLTDSLEQQPATDDTSNSEEADNEEIDGIVLRRLALQCNEIAQDLILQLSKLRKHNSSSRLKSLRQALEAALSKEQVQSIEDRMKKFQDQINSRILTSLKFLQSRMAAQQSIMAAEQKQGFARLDENGKALLSTLERFETIYGTHLLNWDGPADVNTRPPLPSRARNTSILDLAQSGEVPAVQSLLSLEPALIQAEDAQGRTPLHLAASNGDHALMLLLLRKAANVKAEDNDSATPLHLAVKAKSARCVRLLVSKYAEREAMDRFMKTPAQYAEVGSEEAWILAYGADIEARDASKTTALVRFSYNGNVEAVESLLVQGADPGAQGPDGPALFIAATKGFDSIVELLLEAKADINARGARRATALGNASLAGNISTVKLLLATPNIDLDATNNSHYTALADACAHSHEEIAAVLIQAGASIEMKDGEGYGPIHIVSRNGTMSIVKELLRRPDINLQWRGRDGWTALAEATRHGHEDVVELLLDFGADANIGCMNDLSTPLIMAAENGSASITKLLLEKGNADTETSQHQGYTALCQACDRGYLHVAQELIVHGASANKREVGHELWSPLHYATRAGGPLAKDLLRLLVIKGKAHVNYQPGCIGPTALYQAIVNGRPDLVSELLDLGADPDITDSNPTPTYDRYAYCPPICLAARESPLKDISEYLRILVDEGKANVNATRKGNLTALHEVCARSAVSALEFLLQRGADKTIKATGLGTPLEYVLRDKPLHWRAMAELLETG